MKRFPLNKALLWKEWRQNRWMLAVLFLFVSWTPFIETMLEWTKTVMNGMMGVPEVDYRQWYYVQFGFTEANAWSFEITGTINGHMYADSGSGVVFNPLFELAPFAVWIWGLLLIARERTPNTLEFLAATPVSRREIAVTKFFFGAVSVVGMMTVNLLFVVGAALVKPAGYTLSAALFWYIYSVSVLLAAFALGFLISVVTGNLIAALGAAFLYFFLPAGVMEMLHLFIPDGSRGELAAVMIRTCLEYIQPISYLHLYQFDPSRMWYAAVLFAAALGLFLLSVRLFDANPLERNGRVLMFGDPHLFWVIFVPMIPAGLFTLFIRDLIWWVGIWVFLPVFVAVYIAGVLVARYWMRQLKRRDAGVGDG